MLLFDLLFTELHKSVIVILSVLSNTISLQRKQRFHSVRFAMNVLLKALLCAPRV